MTGPGATRLPGIHDQEADRHGDGDIDEANHEQLAALAQRKAGTDERVEDRKENERDGERLEQRDDEAGRACPDARCAGRPDRAPDRKITPSSAPQATAMSTCV